MPPGCFWRPEVSSISGTDSAPIGCLGANACVHPSKMPHRAHPATGSRQTMQPRKTGSTRCPPTEQTEGRQGQPACPCFRSHGQATHGTQRAKQRLAEHRVPERARKGALPDAPTTCCTTRIQWRDAFGKVAQFAGMAFRTIDSLPRTRSETSRIHTRRSTPLVTRDFSCPSDVASSFCPSRVGEPSSENWKEAWQGKGSTFRANAMKPTPEAAPVGFVADQNDYPALSGTILVRHSAARSQTETRSARSVTKDKRLVPGLPARRHTLASTAIGRPAPSARRATPPRVASRWPRHESPGPQKRAWFKKGGQNRERRLSFQGALPSFLVPSPGCEIAEGACGRLHGQ